MPFLILFNPLLILKNVSKTPKNLFFFFFFFGTTKRQISTKTLPIHAILTKACDKILCFL
ncbi:hypothetical protein HpHCM73_07350 [Helicobacter pylori]